MKKLTNIKSLVILTVALFLIFLAVLFGPKIYKNIQDAQIKKKLTLNSKEFVENWGTYDYQSHDEEYYKKLKKYTTDEYSKTLKNQVSKDARPSSFLQKEKYSCKLTAEEITSFKNEQGTYTLVFKVKFYTSTKTNGEKEEQKIVTITWVKVGKELKVSRAILK